MSIISSVSPSVQTRPAFDLSTIDFVTVGYPATDAPTTPSIPIVTLDDLDTPIYPITPLSDWKSLTTAENREVDRAGREATAALADRDLTPEDRSRSILAAKSRTVARIIAERPAYLPSPEDDAALLGLLLGEEGEESVAIAADHPAGSESLLTAFAASHAAGLAEFRAREAARVARSLAYDTGFDMGHSGFIAEPPYAMNPDEHRAFMRGYRAGEQLAKSERPRQYHSCEVIEAFGSRMAGAIEEAGIWDRD